MTIDADWADLEPGTVIDRQVHQAVLASPDDVRRLVDALAQPNTSEAHLVHAGRPKRYNKILGRFEADNRVFLAVANGFGYMEFFDPEHWSQLAGDPTSPEWHTTSSGYFHPGTGVSLDTLVDAVSEFLATGERPVGMQWRECSDTGWADQTTG
jgi:hypothetical protein